MNNDNEQSFPNALAQGVESTPSSEEAFLDYLDMEVNLIWAGNPDKETLDNFRRSQDAAIGEQGQMPMNTTQEVEWLSNLHDRLLDHETTSQGVERLKLMLLERAIIAAILRRSPNDEKTVGHKASLLPRLTRHAKSLSKTEPDNYETHLSQFQKFYTKDARTYTRTRGNCATNAAPISICAGSRIAYSAQSPTGSIEPTSRASRAKDIT